MKAKLLILIFSFFLVNIVTSQTANPVNDIELCDDVTDGDGTNGIVQVFDLDSQTTIILGAQNPADYTVTYHASQADATAGSNAILTSAAYTNITPNLQTIYARVTDNNTTNFDTTSFDVIVNPIPIANFVSDLEVCDDNSDGSAQNGFSQSFDLQLQTATILGAQDPGTFSVTYHTSLANAQAGVNPLGSPFSNTVPFSQTIYVRVFNSATQCANGISNFNVVVNPQPTTESISNLTYCDDATDGDNTNGFVQNIDLDGQIQSILGDSSIQDQSDFTVTFHQSQTDAVSGANSLSSPYTNTTPNQQTIYVRVENNNTGCINDDLTFNIIVNPLPTITASVELKQCDDNTDGFSDFNLNEAASDISTNYLNETFRFYTSLADAQNDINQITNANTFTNTTVTSDTVWARAISASGCFKVSEVTLTVSTTGIPSTFQRIFNECDDFLDSNGNDNAGNDNTDGIATFNFSSVTAEVNALFPVSQQLTITYYRNQADALSEVNAITDPSNYRNIGSPNSQTIYIRVDSNLDNDCVGFGPYITLNVDSVPVSNPVNPLEVCDDDLDGFASFDLSLKDNEIINGQADVAISYHLTLNDANSNTNPLISPYTNTVPNSQTIYTRVVHLTTGCFTTLVQLELIAKDCTDTDSDTVADEDEDINNNGNLDDDDTDTDTIPNYLDDDDDGDGVLTIDEDYNNNGDPTDDDINTNGIPDYLDNTATLRNTDIESFTFKLYPNPSKGFLSFQFSDRSITNLEVVIYDLNGRTIKKSNSRIENQKATIDISRINNGIYFVRIKSDTKIAIKKIIVENN